MVHNTCIYYIFDSAIQEVMTPEDLDIVTQTIKSFMEAQHPPAEVGTDYGPTATGLGGVAFMVWAAYKWIKKYLKDRADSSTEHIEAINNQTEAMSANTLTMTMFIEEHVALVKGQESNRTDIDKNTEDIKEVKADVKENTKGVRTLKEKIKDIC